MESLQILRRSEMKTILAGYMNECATDCNALYGGYYEQCGQNYGRSTNNWALCIDEVHDLNTVCLNGCF